MVDDEWYSMVLEDVLEEVSHTFLKDCPIVGVSSVTGEGLKELTALIDKETEEVPARNTTEDFRLPVDRVFSISGFGTVVTGTLISGAIKEGDSCEIYPSGLKTKIRGIQVHDNPVDIAECGQRVAMNLANLKTDQVKRGDVIAKPESLQPSMMVDCRLSFLNDAPRPLKNRDRVRVYHGTSEILGRVVLLDKDEVNQGEDALIQIRLEEEMAARRGDKYVIRSYSPMITIGGGTILNPAPSKHKVHDGKVIEELLVMEKGDPEFIIEQVVKKSKRSFPGRAQVELLSGKGIPDIEGLLKALVEEKRIIGLPGGDGLVYIHAGELCTIKEEIENILSAFHKTNPLKQGIKKEEIKSRVFGDIKQRLFDEILKLLSEDTIEIGTSLIWKKGFAIKFDQNQERIMDQIYGIFDSALYQPPLPEQIISSFGRDSRTASMVFEALVDSGRLVKINEEIYLPADKLGEAREKAVAYIKENGQITAGDFRDLIGASRKYAVPILEYFDYIKLTRRIEDKRVLFSSR
jgi:selenocysteine-specific elongation factor